MFGKVILVTSASGELGRLAANALSQSGHRVYAALAGGRCEARRAADLRDYARENAVDLRPLAMNTRQTPSIAAAVARILAEADRIDAVVHISEALAVGPAEAFTAEQFAVVHDRIVLTAQRVNRAVLPHMRARRTGLLVWVSSSTPAGGSLPYLAPYVAARAALDALAVQYAGELAPWGIETTLVVPGAQMLAADRLAQALIPNDALRAGAYEAGPAPRAMNGLRRAVASLVPPDADVGPVAGAIVEAVDMPAGERPFRLHVDPVDDGGAIALALADRLRHEMLARTGLARFITPRRARPA